MELTPHNTIRLAVLISGGGRTLVNLQRCIDAGTLPARIDIVVSSRSDAQGVERARALDLPTVVVARKACTGDEFQAKLSQAVRHVDLVCMAGFLSFWRIPQPMLGRVVNIHPALLPEFGGRGMYGGRVHQAVLRAGKRRSGCTVHYCDNEYDHGPIILQRTVDVPEGDTTESLGERVFEQECIAYPEAIRMIAQRRVSWDAGAAVFR